MALDMNKLREFAAELGYWPATTDEDDIARHRRLNAALDKASDAEKLAKKYAHLHERKRQEQAEAAGRLAAMTDDEILAYQREKHGDPYMPLSMAKKMQSFDYRWLHDTLAWEKRRREG